LETSMPAHRGCTTSMTHLTFSRPTGVCRLELIAGRVFRGGRIKTGL